MLTLETNYSVQKVWKTEKKCRTCNTKFACQVLFFLLLLISFYFILKTDVFAAICLPIGNSRLGEYRFATSITAWQTQSPLSERWSITGISNFQKSQHITLKRSISFTGHTLLQSANTFNSIFLKSIKPTSYFDCKQPRAYAASITWLSCSGFSRNSLKQNQLRVWLNIWT